MSEPFSKVTIIRVFKYLNKMVLKYYWYWYLRPFPSKNIFGYLFGKYVASEYICLVNYMATEYIRIFVWVHFMILAHHCDGAHHTP